MRRRITRRLYEKNDEYYNSSVISPKWQGGKSSFGYRQGSCLYQTVGRFGTGGKYPYIGWGHRLLPHEKLTENLSEAQADSLLRCDLERCLKVFRKYGKDSLLLSVLGFNVGCYRLVGDGKIPKSRLIQKLESGDRDIYKEYISFRCYRGKVIPSIEGGEKRNLSSSMSREKRNSS